MLQCLGFFLSHFASVDHLYIARHGARELILLVLLLLIETQTTISCTANGYQIKLSHPTKVAHA